MMTTQSITSVITAGQQKQLVRFIATTLDDIDRRALVPSFQ
jgi:hypothetical protein